MESKASLPKLLPLLAGLRINADNVPAESVLLIMDALGEVTNALWSLCEAVDLKKREPHSDHADDTLRRERESASYYLKELGLPDKTARGLCPSVLTQTAQHGDYCRMGVLMTIAVNPKRMNAAGWAAHMYENQLMKSRLINHDGVTQLGLIAIEKGTTIT